MIVEDNELLRKVIHESLTRHFPAEKIISFGNGADAVATIKKAAPFPIPPIPG